MKFEMATMMKFEIAAPLAGNGWLAEYIETLPASFLSGGTLIWNGRNKIRSYQDALIDDKGRRQTVVVKRFKRLSAVQKLVYMFRRHKARKAFCNGILLQERGFDTPTPMAYAELRNGPWLMDAYYISGATALDCIESQTDRDDWNHALAAAFGRFVARLHGQGVLHHDLNDTNVLYAPTPDGDYRFVLIDINRMKFYDPSQQIPAAECIENLTRFTGRMDLYEFVIREYAAARGLDIEPFTQRAIAQKQRHDLRWHRRKRFTRMFKRKRQPHRP